MDLFVVLRVYQFPAHIAAIIVEQLFDLLSNNCELSLEKTRHHRSIRKHDHFNGNQHRVHLVALFRNFICTTCANFCIKLTMIDNKQIRTKQLKFQFLTTLLLKTFRQQLRSMSFQSVDCIFCYDYWKPNLICCSHCVSMNRCTINKS